VTSESESTTLESATPAVNAGEDNSTDIENTEGGSFAHLKMAGLI